VKGNKRASTPTRLRGLTLIELVLVCAIIAVLVGIVWVVMAPVREKARQVYCINNLKQIHHAFMLYREDYGGYAEPEIGRPRDPAELGLPCVSWRLLSRQSAPLPPPAITLDMLLKPYISGIDVWRCLNDPTPLEEFLKNHYGSYVQTLPFDGCWYEEVKDVPRDRPLWWFMDRFRRMTATCGDRMPLMFCPWHGWEQGTDSYLIVMRWNGEVKGQYVQQFPNNLCLFSPGEEVY